MKMKVVVVVCVSVLIGATEAGLQSLSKFRTEIETGDVFKNERETRSTKLSFVKELGSFMVVKGLKASKQLLTGAEEISTHGKTRQFKKFGDVRDAFQDFMAVNIGGVRNFRSRDGSLGKVGQIGDRKIKLIRRGANGKPAIEITKMESTLNHAEISRDIITYSKPSP